MKKVITLLSILCSSIIYGQEFPIVPCDTTVVTFEGSPTPTPMTDSIIIAGGVIRGTPKNVVGSLIDWKFIGAADAHDKVWFDSVKALPSGLIRIYYPKVSKVVSFIATGDEILSKYATFGSSVDVSYADIYVGTVVVNGGEIKGNNTSSCAKGSSLGSWDVVRDSTGLFRLNIGVITGLTMTAFDYAKLTVTYTGSNIRFVKRVFNGLGSYNAGFYLTDANGTIIKGNSDVNDRVVVSSGMTTQNVNAYKVGGDLYEYNFWRPMSNIWIMAEFKK
jgi:hypothetical protein